MIIKDIELKSLRSWALNPRAKRDKKWLHELANSLRTVGQQTVLIVRPVAGEEEAYEVIVGETRRQAAGIAGLRTLSCEVREISDKEALEIAVCEQLQRRNLDIVEEAAAYQQMIRLEWSVAEIAERSGRSARAIYQLVGLLALDAKCLEELRDGLISRNTAEALLRIEDIDRRHHALERVIRKGDAAGPMPEKVAVTMIQADYIAPQKRAAQWEARRREVEAAWPGAERVSTVDSWRYLQYGSGYVKVADRPEDWELAVHVRGREVPTWGELAAKHGAKLVIVPDDEGDPVALVEKQPIVSAELALGEGDPRGCVFAVAAPKGRHEQSMARALEEKVERVEAAKEAQELRATRQQALRVLHRRRDAAMWSDPRCWEMVGEGVVALLGTRLREAAAVLGVDLAADGNTEEGLRRWVENLLETAGPGYVFLLARWEEIELEALVEEQEMDPAA